MLKADPTYSDAEHNLGRALLAQGKLDEPGAGFGTVPRAHSEST